MVDEEGEVLTPPLHVVGPAVFLVEDMVVVHLLLGTEVGESVEVRDFSSALLPVVLHIPRAPVMRRIGGGFGGNEIGCLGCLGGAQHATYHQQTHGGKFHQFGDHR